MGILDNAASALGGRVKESLGVSKETKGFGNIMGGAFSAANMFGADSFLGETFSSDEERDRVKQFNKDQKSSNKEKASSSGGGLFGGAAKVENAGINAEGLEGIADDVKTIRDISEEEYTAPPVEAKADKKEDKEDKDPEFDQLRKKEEVKKKEVAKVVGITSAQGDTMIGLLEDIARGIGGIDGGGGGMSTPSMRTKVPKVKPPTTRPNSTKPTKVPTKPTSPLAKATSAAKGVAKGVGSGLAKVGAKGVPILGTALAVGEGALDVYDAEQDMENLEVTAEEAQIAKGEGVGKAAGTLAGAATGAAVGSVVPVVGTIVGGIVGGALGYFAGGEAGGALADALPVDPGEIAESNAVAEELLEDASTKIDGKKLVDTIRSDASEIEATLTEATLEESGKDELSENDKAAIANASLVKAIQNNKEALDAVGVSMDPEAMQAINERIEKRQETNLEAAEDSGLYDKDMMGNSEIDKEKLATTEDTGQLNAMLMDRDLSEEDTAAVQSRLNDIKATPDPLEASVLRSNSQSANTPAATVEDATDVAAKSNAPAAPVVIQAPGGQAAPVAAPDVNVLVTLPKSISPNNATGTRYLASVMS